MIWIRIQSLIAPVLPVIQEDLGTTQSTVTWVLTANLLSASIFTPILGPLGDWAAQGQGAALHADRPGPGRGDLGRRPTIGVMLVGRAVSGLGGGVLPLAFGIVRDELPRERVAGAVALVAALLAIGTGLGVVLAGPIVAVGPPRRCWPCGWSACSSP